MMKKNKLFLLACSFFCLGGINAQTANLGLTSNSLNLLPGVVNYGSYYTDSITIYNTGTVGFSGLITIEALINDSLVTAVDDTSQGTILDDPNASTSDSIAPGGSIYRGVVIHVQPPFIIGTSGVVIWPKVISQTYPLITATIADSVSKTVTVLYPVGIDEITERNLKVYMNGQQLMIQDDGKYLLKSVELYDVSGKLLNEQQISTSGTLDMNEYATGVYLAEINFADNTRVTFKVFNPK